MDISKYIDENLDEIIDDPEAFIQKSLNFTNLQNDEQNEDNDQDDLIGELHQNYYEKKFNHKKSFYKKNNPMTNPNSNFEINSKSNFEINSKSNKKVEFNLDKKSTNESDEEPDDQSNNEESDDQSESDDEPEQVFGPLVNDSENTEDLDDSDNSEKLDQEQSKSNDESNGLDLQDNDEQTQMDFYFGLMNVFMKYYNEKYEKKEHFFSGVKDVNKDTSTCMELFFESVIEFKQLKEKLNEEVDEELKDNDESLNNLALKFYFDHSDKEKVSSLFDSWSGQIYCLQVERKKIISPSLFTCLHIVLTNNLLDKECWNIFCLRDN